jgi:predicted dehydrogenase
MAKRIIRFGIIGGGLMGREFASAAARWCHLYGLDFEPRVEAMCSITLADLEWFRCSVPGLRLVTSDYRELLDDPEIEAIYCAVPHNLHAQIYIDTIRAGKHLLGEKPFGIDQAANRAILDAVRDNPRLLVRCSSQFPFFPGAYRICEWIREGRLGQIIDVEAGFWHSSDLNPTKPINWKRRVAENGEYGCMGDLGMHVVHMPFRLGWHPKSVRALLSKVVKERPDRDGKLVPCETWDNAILACDAEGPPVYQSTDLPASAHQSTRLGAPMQEFPMLLSMKRIAPGHANTWFIRVNGMALSAEFSTVNPKRLAWLPYEPGGEQAWHVIDVPHQSAYPSITGSIFEFGFSDALMQMWAAYCDELVHGPDMRQPLRCATPEETALSHTLFTAALESQRTGQTVALEP